jgi:hypothetical protein
VELLHFYWMRASVFRMFMSERVLPLLHFDRAALRVCCAVHRVRVLIEAPSIRRAGLARFGPGFVLLPLVLSVPPLLVIDGTLNALRVVVVALAVVMGIYSAWSP